MTETLSYDINRVLGVPQECVGHEKDNRKARKSDLTDRARKNLVRYIRNDYDALIKLHEYGLIEHPLIKSIIDRAELEK